MEQDEETTRLAGLVRESLREHLRAVGLHPWNEGERVWTGLGEAWCRVFVDEPQRRPSLCLVPVWIEMVLDGTDDGAVRESLAGTGATAEEAAVAAAHDWMDVVFLPVRQMLDPVFHSDHVEVLPLVSRDDDTGEATAWTIYAGPPLLRGADAEAILAAVERQPPIGLVLQQVTGHLHRRERHWVKTYLARWGDQVQGEVTIDNAPDEDALAALARFAWPDVEGYASFRRFYILQPDPGAEPDPGLVAGLPRVTEPARRPWWKLW